MVVKAWREQPLIGRRRSRSTSLSPGRAPGERPAPGVLPAAGKLMGKHEKVNPDRCLSLLAAAVAPGDGLQDGMSALTVKTMAGWQSE